MASYTLVFTINNALILIFSDSLKVLYWCSVANAFLSGGFIVVMAAYVHEEHGSDAWSRIFGCLLTFGSFGLFVFDELVFNYAYSHKDGNVDHDSELETYLFEDQNWNIVLYRISMISLGFACLSALLGWCFA
jgi:hypothetical protein